MIRAVRKVQHLVRKGKRAPRIIEDPLLYLHELRLVKTPRRDRGAAASGRGLRAQGHVRGMRCTRPGMREFELQAEIEYVFKKHGANAPGYASIVGVAGPNACVLHYVANRGRLRDGDLVLVDAGAEVGLLHRRHHPDLARLGHLQPASSARSTTSSCGRSRRSSAWCGPGCAWNELHQTAVRVITEGLVDLGVLEGPGRQGDRGEDLPRTYFMHGTGHWLGIDVHDVGAYAHDGEPGRALEPGMVFTVEPGIYFHADQEGCPERYRGIGVRIEDDILVTETAHEVLSACRAEGAGRDRSARRAGRLSSAGTSGGPADVLPAALADAGDVHEDGDTIRTIQNGPFTPPAEFIAHV